jgi:m7GpppX diphosphatase
VKLETVPTPEKRKKEMNFKDFELVKIINEDGLSKHLALHLKKTETEDAVLLLNKLPFNSAESLEKLLFGLEPIDTNDIYHRFIDKVRGVECKVIYPATPAHIKKYSDQSRRIIRETPVIHKSITRPHFQQLRESGQVSWIDNIIKDESELDRRIIDKKCPQTGFIILPDYKWTDESNLSGLYLLVIPRRDGLWSVRDLTGEHVPLLKEIKRVLKEEIFSEIKHKYNYPDGSAVLYSHLRVYFHYPPTYPHLHLHVTLASSSQSSCSAGQAILLDEVIDNLENVSSDYYKNIRTLSMEFGDQHELYRKLMTTQ